MCVYRSRIVRYIFIPTDDDDDDSDYDRDDDSVCDSDYIDTDCNNHDYDKL